MGRPPIRVDYPVRLNVLVHIVDIGTGVALEILRETVCHLVIFPLDICYVEVESGHVIHPLALPVRQLRLCLEEFERLMVRYYMEPDPYEFILPFLECF